MKPSFAHIYVDCNICCDGMVFYSNQYEVLASPHKVCRESDSNRHEVLSSQVFETCVSTSSTIAAYMRGMFTRSPTAFFLAEFRKTLRYLSAYVFYHQIIVQARQGNFLNKVSNLVGRLLTSCGLRSWCYLGKIRLV